MCRLCAVMNKLLWNKERTRNVCAHVCVFVCLHVYVFLQVCLCGCVLERPSRWPSGKASASRAEDPGFESRLRQDFFGVESYH